MKIIGSMRRIDEKRGAVRVEDVYDTDIDDLWSAITEPDRLAHWTPSGRPQAPSPNSPAPGRALTHPPPNPPS